MDGDNDREKTFGRNIQLEYKHDRLMDMKIIQAYQLLVPDKSWVRDIKQKGGDPEHATSRAICESVIGPSKRRAHY